MKDRLLKFITREELTSARFAEIIGVQPSSISHILSGRNKPGFDFIQKILANFPTLSAEWLIMGRGPVYKQQNIQRDLFSETIEYPDNNATQAPGEELEEDIAGEVDTNVNSKHDDADYKSNVNIDSGITNVIKGPRIEKVVILYTDNTFYEYSPGKESGK